MQLSTLSSWAMLIWQVLGERGFDTDKLFREAGMDPAMMSDPNARYPMDAMHKLWRLIEQHTDDEAIGLAIGKRWEPTSFHALGFAWLASRSLQMGLQRLCRYARIVHSGAVTKLTNKGSTYELAFYMSAYEGILHPLANDAAHATFNHMCRMLCGDQFRPVEVYSMRPPTSIGVLLEAEVQAPYHLGSDNNVWTFDRLDVERTLPFGNPGLAMANEQLALDYLNRMDLDDISARTRKYITHHLPSGPVTQEMTARELNMSVRSLQRRLEEEGYTFAGLMEEIRQDLAETYVRNSRLTLNEITYLLGFSEPASFTRAFRRWKGTSPSRYRQEVLTKTVA